jgi:mannose-6-phosphate isomerase-like protein (cupin superfamily)
MIGSHGFFFHLSEQPYKEKRADVLLKSITGEKSQLCLIQLAPSSSTRHAHDNEQIGYVLTGEVTVAIGETTEVLRAGDAYYIPAYFEHSFVVPSTSCLEYLEVFCPPKPDNDL